MIDAADQAGGGFSIKWSVTFPPGYFAHREMAEWRSDGVTEPICLPWKSLETLTADITPVMHDAWWRRNSLDTTEKNKNHMPRYCEGSATTNQSAGKWILTNHRSAGHSPRSRKCCLPHRMSTFYSNKVHHRNSTHAQWCNYVREASLLCGFGLVNK